jgi:hypothetical protein
MLYNIIQLIHTIIILLIIISIFYPNNKLKELSLSLLILLMIKYLIGHQRCGLTEIEYLLKGEKYKEGFIYRIVKPMITIPELYFENYLFIIHSLFIIILFHQIHYS